MKGILIAWGTPVVGRERPALEEFASYMQWVNTLKTQNKISRFEIYAPLFGQFEKSSGFSIIEGTVPQIDEVLASDDFRARIDRVVSVVQGVRVESLDVGDDVGKRMKLYGAALQQLKL